MSEIATTVRTDAMWEMLTTEQAALYLGLSPRTLEKRRTVGGGPPFLKLGRAVRYRLCDLEEWIAQRRRRSTSDPGAVAEPGPGAQPGVFPVRR
ncbi:MAG TPA: helix-turn-helix domain-containing protein [Thermoanaerobaculia bacterium]|nr:helix-turn-helix domain-containing protein [Thermoanaerobaculia bacterium]